MRCGIGWRSGSFGGTGSFASRWTSSFVTWPPALELPAEFQEDGHKCEGELAVLMLLAKLSSPRSLRPDLELIFLQDQSRISRFINLALSHIYKNFAHTFAFDTRRLRPKIPYYAYMVGRKFGVPLPYEFRVWGFVDGTFHEFARPSRGQESVYNGTWVWMGV